MDNEKAIKELEAKRDKCFRSIVKRQKELNEIDKDLECIRIEPALTKHCRLRYLERILGYDPKEIRKKNFEYDAQEIHDKILDDKTKNIIKTIRDGIIKRNGHTLVVKDYVVLTIINKEEDKKK